MTHHKRLEDRALEALRELHGDMSVSLEGTLFSLQVVRDELDMLIDAVEGDIERALEIDCNEASM